MRKLKLFALLAAILFATSMWAANPIGCVDAWQGNDGSIYIKGWAYDSENTNAALAIHVYMYKAGVADPVWSEGNTVANSYRPDVNNVHGCGNNHGFERYISTANVTPGTYWINIYALHAAGTSGTNVRLQQAGTSDQYDLTITVKSPLTISYDANGGSNAPSSQQKCYGININLQGKGSLARTGYTTDGWATSSTGGKAYDFGGTYSGNSSTKLYAHWNLVNYSISYTLNGGSVTGNPTSYNVTTNTFTLKNPTRTGYTFAGWTGSNGTTKQTTVQIAKGSTGDKSYTANWTANQYTITLDPQGGTGGDASKTATFGSATPTVNIPGRNGYSFGGYYTGKNGSGTQYLKPDANNTATSVRNWDIASNTTLYAKWNARTYTVTFDQQGGNGGTASATATFDANMPAATMPTRTGYTFQGYYDATSGGTLYYNADGTSARTWNKTAAATLYARWTINTYTIVYDLAGGEVATANPTEYTVETATFTLNNPSKDHSDFLGWTGSNGDSPQLEVSIAKGSTGDKNYVANWLLHTYTLESDETMATDWTVTPSPVGVGQTVTATYSGTKHVKSVTYMGVPVVTAPTAKQGLTYTGSEQALVVAGSTTGGTLQYQLNGGEWSTTVPSAINAGTYEVAYRVLGNDTFVGNDGGSFNVTIAKADPGEVTLSKTSIAFGADDFTTTFTVTRTGDGAISVSSSNDEVKCTLSGNTVTVRRRSGRPLSNVTITVSVAASANYLAPANKTCSYSHSALRTPANIQAKDKGCFLGAYGYLWPKDYATDIVEPLRAVVAYVGSCDKYFDKCLCIALEDISNTRLSRADAATAVNTWASSHSVNVGGTVYSSDAGGYYDFAGPNNYKIRDWAVAKGWRIPTVCDWRYIMNAYKGSSLTNPAGVNHGVNPNLCKWSELRTAINSATGGTAMKTDNNYGSSTRDDGNSNIGTWHVGSGEGGWATWWWANDHDGYKYYYRAVFAY